jgi:hypothetical protein
MSTDLWTRSMGSWVHRLIKQVSFNPGWMGEIRRAKRYAQDLITGVEKKMVG